MDRQDAEMAMNLLVDAHLIDRADILDNGKWGCIVDCITKEGWKKQFNSLDDVQTYVRCVAKVPIASREMALHRLTVAAPQLLEALQNLIQYSDHYEGECPTDSGLGAYLQAKAAIDKATGVSLR
jgi:hypothetical protein